MLVSLRRVDTTAADVAPSAPAEPPYAACLMRRENREANPQLGKNFQRLKIDCGFRQPHARRRPLEAALEVANAPQDLRISVARVGQRQNHMIVDLG